MRFLVGTTGGPVKAIRGEDGKVLGTFPLPPGEGTASSTAASAPATAEAMLWADGCEHKRFLVAAAGRILACETATFSVRPLSSYTGGTCRLLAVLPSGAGDVVTVAESGAVAIHRGVALPDAVKHDPAEPDATAGELAVPGPVHGACLGDWGADGGAVLATGGKNNDAAVHSILLPQSPPPPPPSSLPSLKALWKAKKLPGDPRTRAPDLIWPTAMAFVPAAPRTLVVASSYGDVRLYNTAIQQRRPIARIVLCERPINCMAWVPSASSSASPTVVCGSTTGDLLMVDLTQKRVVGGFHGIGGAVRAVWAGEQAVVCCGVDRYVHTFARRTRARMSRVYVKQMASALLVISEDADALEDGPASEKRKTADELWASLSELPFDEDAKPLQKRKRQTKPVTVDEDGADSDDGNDVEDEDEEEEEEEEEPKKRRK